jgi:hypothetical protein
MGFFPQVEAACNLVKTEFNPTGTLQAACSSEDGAQFSADQEEFRQPEAELSKALTAVQLSSSVMADISSQGVEDSLFVSKDRNLHRKIFEF